MRITLLNAIGCLVLTAVIITLWQRERSDRASITSLRSELNLAAAEAAKADELRSALERDISVLKESIASAQTDAETANRNFAEKNQLAIQLQDELGAAREQIIAWEIALKDRDERIRSLDADLSAARKRLDEAIAKLKASGATQP